MFKRYECKSTNLIFELNVFATRHTHYGFYEIYFRETTQNAYPLCVGVLCAAGSGIFGFSFTRIF